MVSQKLTPPGWQLQQEQRALAETALRSLPSLAADASRIWYGSVQKLSCGSCTASTPPSPAGISGKDRSRSSLKR